MKHNLGVLAAVSKCGIAFGQCGFTLTYPVLHRILRHNNIVRRHHKFGGGAWRIKHGQRSLINMDEQVNLRLRYFSHGLAGLILGLLLYAIYVRVVNAQPATVDYDGYVVVWESRISYVMKLGLIMPLVCTMTGAVVAWLCPVQQLCTRTAVRTLVVTAVVLTVTSPWLAGRTITRVFPTLRQMSGGLTTS